MNETKTASLARVQLIGAMAIFGTIGLFVRYIPLPSSVIALVRGIVGTLFLLLVTLLRRSHLSGEAIRRNLLLLCVSGAFIGFNWIFLFESYRYTTVATATLCYYLAPIFVILASPLVLREKLTGKKLLCVLVALVGMVFVSGVLQSVPSMAEIKGILFGVGAAALYASVILMNKKFRDIAAYDRTIMQLGLAALVLLPYTLLTEDFSAMSAPPLAIVLLIFLGIVHTGMAYVLYFGSMQHLPAQTVALFSYVDPIVAIILSALFLQEPMTVSNMVGAAMILGAALVSDLS